MPQAKREDLLGEKPDFGRDQILRLGAEIRRIRQERRLSLRRVADISGLSIATVQALEAGDGSPTLMTVLSVAETLGEPVDQLIAASMTHPQPPLVRRGSVPLGGAASTRVLPDLDGERIASKLVVVPAGSALPEADRPDKAPVLAYMVEGRLDLAFDDGRTERLDRDDAAHLAGEIPSAWVNPSRRRAVLLCLADHGAVG